MTGTFIAGGWPDPAVPVCWGVTGGVDLGLRPAPRPAPRDSSTIGVGGRACLARGRRRSRGGSDETFDGGTTHEHRRVGVGSRFHLVARCARRDVPLEYVIVAFDPPKAVTLRAEHARVVSLDTITFESSTTGTAGTYDADLRRKGALGILDPVLALALRRIGDRARDALRQVLQPSTNQPE